MLAVPVSIDSNSDESISNIVINQPYKQFFIFLPIPPENMTPPAAFPDKWIYQL